MYMHVCDFNAYLSMRMRLGVMHKKIARVCVCVCLCICQEMCPTTLMITHVHEHVTIESRWFAVLMYMCVCVCPIPSASNIFGISRCFSATSKARLRLYTSLL